jgi:ABC-type nitrate/sulfonate/bicarbonate transport system permease component
VTGRRLREIGLGVAGTIAFLAVWELAARAGPASALFPPPSRAIAEALTKLPPAAIADHVAVSLGRITAGFAAGAALGVAVAVAAGWYRTFGNFVRPVIELLRPIPPLAWIPMAIVWFGLGEASKVFVIFLGAFFPVLTNAYRGITAVDPTLVRAAQTMDVTGIALLWRVMLPAALPDIAVGLRVGWGLSFGVLVAAELIAADRGMGYLIMNARQTAEVGVIIFGILLIGLATLATDWLLGLAVRRSVGRWHAV